MIEFKSINSDLGRYYPNTDFKNKDLIVERLKYFFKQKSLLFLQENPILNEEGLNNFTEYISNNALIPINRNYNNLLDNISGLRESFIEAYREDIFNYIPMECKKNKSGMQVSLLSNKKLMDYNNFLLYRYLIPIVFVYDFSFSKLFSDLNISEEELDKDLLNCLKQTTLHSVFYEAMSFICPKHLFTIGTWMGHPNFERCNSETNRILENKVELHEELLRRGYDDTFFVDDQENLIREKFQNTNLVNKEIIFRNSLLLLELIRNKRLHLV